MEHFKEVPLLSVEVSIKGRRVLLAGDLLPRLHGLDLRLQDSTAAEQDELADILQQASSLKTACFRDVDHEQVLRMWGDKLAMVEMLEFR